MKKYDKKRFIKKAGITSNIHSKNGKNSYVNLESLEKICIALDCRIEDVVEITKDIDGEK